MFTSLKNFCRNNIFISDRDKPKHRICKISYRKKCWICQHYYLMFQYWIIWKFFKNCWKNQLKRLLLFDISFTNHHFDLKRAIIMINSAPIDDHMRTRRRNPIQDGGVANLRVHTSALNTSYRFRKKPIWYHMYPVTSKWCTCRILLLHLHVPYLVKLE